MEHYSANLRSCFWIWPWLHQDWMRMNTLKSCHEHSFTPSYFLFSWKCFSKNVWRSWALNGLWVFLWWLYSCQGVGLKTTTINPMLHPLHRFPVKRSQSFVLGQTIVIVLLGNDATDAALDWWLLFWGPHPDRNKAITERPKAHSRLMIAIHFLKNTFMRIGNTMV